jgi:hypothetical protein
VPTQLPNPYGSNERKINWNWKKHHLCTWLGISFFIPKIFTMYIILDMFYILLICLYMWIYGTQIKYQYQYQYRRRRQFFRNFDRFYVFELVVQWAASVLKSTDRQQHLQNTLTVFQVQVEFLSLCRWGLLSWVLILIFNTFAVDLNAEYEVDLELVYFWTLKLYAR